MKGKLEQRDKWEKEKKVNQIYYRKRKQIRLLVKGLKASCIFR